MQLSACLRPRAAVVAQARREAPAKAKGRSAKPATKPKTAPKGGSKGGKGVDSNTGEKRVPLAAAPAGSRLVCG